MAKWTQRSPLAPREEASPIAEREAYFPRRGMTLLELILALALSAVLMMAISMAIDIHLRMLDSRRTNVEEAQLARAVLSSLSNDIRGQVPHVEIDWTSVENAATDSAASAAGNLINSAMGQSGASGQQGAPAQGNTGQGNTGQGNTGQGNTGQTGAAQTGATSTQASSTRSGSSTTGQTGSRSTTGAAGSAPSSAAGAGLGQGTSAGGTGQTGSAAGTTQTEEGAETTTPPSIPRLYGSQYELQVDVSRLPRLDEYGTLVNAPAAGQSIAKIPSDVKTVTYYLQTLEGGSPSLGQTRLAGRQTGLMRREVDRAVTSWAATSGQIAQSDDAAKVLAPEVTSLEFSYFDGTQWVVEWDSDVMGSLPMAIEVKIGVASSRSQLLQKKQGLSPQAPFAASADDLIYRLVVRLPAAQPASETTGATTDPATDPATTGATGNAGAAPTQGATP